MVRLRKGFDVSYVVMVDLYVHVGIGAFTARNPIHIHTE